MQYLFSRTKKKRVYYVTDFKMTRCLNSLKEAVEKVFMAFRGMDGSEIFVRNIPSVKTLYLAKYLAPKYKIIETGLRLGKKLHDRLISRDESKYLYEFGDYYKILLPLHGWNKS